MARECQGSALFYFAETDCFPKCCLKDQQADSIADYLMDHIDPDAFFADPVDYRNLGTGELFEPVFVFQYSAEEISEQIQTEPRQDRKVITGPEAGGWKSEWDKGFDLV